MEDFKNDKQALEYQQRIVDILLKVQHLSLFQFKGFVGMGTYVYIVKASELDNFLSFLLFLSPSL